MIPRINMDQGQGPAFAWGWSAGSRGFTQHSWYLAAYDDERGRVWKSRCALTTIDEPRSTLPALNPNQTPTYCLACIGLSGPTELPAGAPDAIAWSSTTSGHATSAPEQPQEARSGLDAVDDTRKAVSDRVGDLTVAQLTAIIRSTVEGILDRHGLSGGWGGSGYRSTQPLPQPDYSEYRGPRSADLATEAPLHNEEEKDADS